MTQKELILSHLKKHNFITSWTAIEAYHITRLAEYIRQLKKTHNIKSERMKGSTANGRTVSYSRYSLIK